ncbi:MAG: Fur family transcriptional regulator [Oscillospiraceae bacterium]
MDNKENKGYKTKQREIILKYLKENSNDHINADELAEHLKNSGNPVGKSTIYRYLDRLCCENMVRKFISPDGKSSCFQIIKDECHYHYHFKCIKCGELLHIKCSSLDNVSTHIQNEHGFKIDLSQTIIYGYCKKCSQEVI